MNTMIKTTFDIVQEFSSRVLFTTPEVNTPASEVIAAFNRFSAENGYVDMVTVTMLGRHLRKLGHVKRRIGRRKVVTYMGVMVAAGVDAVSPGILSEPLHESPLIEVIRPWGNPRVDAVYPAETPSMGPKAKSQARREAMQEWRRIAGFNLDNPTFPKTDAEFMTLYLGKGDTWSASFNTEEPLDMLETSVNPLRATESHETALPHTSVTLNDSETTQGISEDSSTSEAMHVIDLGSESDVRHMFDAIVNPLTEEFLVDSPSYPSVHSDPTDLGAGKTCRHWIGSENRYCNGTHDVHLFIQGMRCADHTPAKISERYAATRKELVTL